MAQLTIRMIDPSDLDRLDALYAKWERCDTDQHNADSRNLEHALICAWPAISRALREQPSAQPTGCVGGLGYQMSDQHPLGLAQPSAEPDTAMAELLAAQRPLPPDLARILHTSMEQLIDESNPAPPAADAPENCPFCGGKKETGGHDPMCGLRTAADAPDGLHPRYGPCDGFGPDGSCSECIGIVLREFGFNPDLWCNSSAGKLAAAMQKARNLIAAMSGDARSQAQDIAKSNLRIAALEAAHTHCPQCNPCRFADQLTDRSRSLGAALADADMERAKRQNLEAALAEREKDAIRYRWLRKHFRFANDGVFELWFDATLTLPPLEDTASLDAAIDRALAASGPTPGDAT